MLQVIPQWRVVVTMPDGAEIKFSVSDAFIGNVLRTVSNLHFGDVLIQPKSITIGVAERSDPHAHDQSISTPATWTFGSNQ